MDIEKISHLKNTEIPQTVQKILVKTKEIGFKMVSELSVGSLLKTLASSKPSGYFLELGTGTGVSTAWILNGMDLQSKLLTVENNATLVAIAKEYLAQDSRVTFHLQDSGNFIEWLNTSNQKFDLIFADTWAGKYTHFEPVMQVLKSGGLYVIDDMLPQINWPEGHGLKVSTLITKLENRQDLSVTQMNWSSGVIIATKR